MTIRRTTLTAVVAATASLALPAGAQATTFCVPSFRPDCPNIPGNVATPNVETGMQMNASDGVADRIEIAAGTYPDTESFETGGTDPLEIIGAGVDQVRLTTNSTGNIFVVNLYFQSRPVTMSGVTIVIPEAMGDGLGGGLQMGKQDVLDHVDIVSLNNGSDGVPSMVGGGTFSNGHIYAQGDEGSIDVAFKPNAATTGSAVIDHTIIEDANTGVYADNGAVPIFLRHSKIIDPKVAGVGAYSSGIANVSNSVIESKGASGVPLLARSGGAGTVILGARHNTIVHTGGAQVAAIQSLVDAGVTGSTNLVVNDTIVRGFAQTYIRNSKSAGRSASLSISYSNLAKAGMSTGTGNFSFAPTNIDADPLFAAPGDYHLGLGSPSIDSGDPLTVSLPTDDFDGAPRPVDGTGDGNARRDMGAFEYQPKPGDPPTGPDPDPDPQPGDPGQPGDPDNADHQAPTISKLKAGRLSAKKGGKVKVTISEDASIALRFKPKRVRGAKPPPVAITFVGKAGRNKLTVVPGALPASSYRLRAIATDDAGNASKPAKLKLRVK
jgi:hypothetical protein